MHRSQSAARSRRTAAALSRRQALGQLGGGVAAAALASLTPWHLTAPRTAAQVSPDPRLTGQVVLPSDTAYDQARLDFNQRFDVFPQAIVYCQSAGDVQNAIRWARAHGFPVTVRSGGHSYEAYSLGPGVVVDVSAMRTVQVDRAQGIAVAQPGIRLLDLYRTLAPDAVTVPGGTCAGVGLGGLTVGGGIGWLSRKWGLTCDNLLALQVVDGNGQLLTADAVQHADLFWALRGGGGSFGVVTSLTLQVHPIGDVVVFSLDWPFTRAGPVLDAWQQVAPHWPEELTVVLEVHGPPDAGAFCDGLFVGDQGQLSALLEPLLRVAAPSRVDVSTVPYLDAAEHYADESQQPYFKAKSDYALAPLSPEAIAVILQFMAASPGREDAIQLQPYGGAISRVPAAATAFPHRAGTLFSLQYLAHWTDEAQGPASLRWIEEFYAAMRPYVSGYAYANNCDADLTDWPHAYYGSNFEALVEVKTNYDPQNLFRFAQSIAPRMAAAAG